MQLHQLSPTHKLKKEKRIGRGGKRGTYSGKGMKGQKSRAGARFEPIIRSLIKKYPKKRGYRFKSFKLKPAVVNIELLEKRFKDGNKINPKTLLEQKLIRRAKGKMPVVKILGNGKLSKKLFIEDCQASKLAKEKIEKAGGTIS